MTRSTHPFANTRSRAGMMKVVSSASPCVYVEEISVDDYVVGQIKSALAMANGGRMAIEASQF